MVAPTLAPLSGSGPGGRGASRPSSRWLTAVARQMAGIPWLCGRSLGNGRLTPVLLRALRGGRIDAGTATGVPADLSGDLLTPWTGSHQRGRRRRPPPPRREGDGR